MQYFVKRLEWCFGKTDDRSGLPVMLGFFEEEVDVGKLGSEIERPGFVKAEWLMIEGSMCDLHGMLHVER